MATTKPRFLHLPQSQLENHGKLQRHRILERHRNRCCSVGMPTLPHGWRLHRFNRLDTHSTQIWMVDHPTPRKKPQKPTPSVCGMFVCARLLGWGESPIEKPSPRSRHLLVAPQQDVQHNFRIPQHVPPLPCVRGHLQTTRHQPLRGMPQKPRRQLGIDVVGVFPVALRVGFFGGGCDQRCRQTNLVGLNSKNSVELFASRDVVQCFSVAVAGGIGISVRSAGRDIHRR